MSSKQQQGDAKDGVFWSCFFNCVLSIFIISPDFEQANFLKVKFR